MKIRFCDNGPKGKGKLAKKLKAQFTSADIKVKDCVKQCKTCRKEFFAVIDRVTLVKGKDWEEVEKKLVEIVTR